MLLRSLRYLLVVAVALGFTGLWAAEYLPPSLDTQLAGQTTLPTRLTDRQFWTLINQLSEPDGYFRSENLVSNEHTFQYVIPALTRAVRPGGVYLGVAPDQNFTYITAIRPKMAFIVDIRRGNLLQHLMYKALIELSADRAEFVSRLFSKKRPAGLRADLPVWDLFDAFDKVNTSQELYDQNVKAIRDLLAKRHGFALSVSDLQQLEWIYYQFFWEGPSLRYTMNGGGGRGGVGAGAGGQFGGRALNGTNFPSYEDLMMQTDYAGRSRSYLANEETFAFLKDFEERNLLVPIVGNFAGPKALRAVGRYLAEHGATVSAFYVSNVEQYLFQDGIFGDFYRNVATLPLEERSTFIRSVSGRMGYSGAMQWSDTRATALDPMKASLRDFTAGRIRSYYDLNAHSK
jgi:hypothetical protein